MKTILVPTDFSEHAFYALKAAASIALKTKAEIVILHVFMMPSFEYSENKYYGEFYEQIILSNNKKLDNLMGEKFLKGLKVSKQIISNMLFHEAVADKRFKHVDLIIMGSHGESGFSKVFIGSNTEKIVRMAEAPVLTIKKEITDFNIRNIVFTSNFYGESYASFDKIKFFADLYKAHINLLKVITPKDFEPTPVSKKLMDDFARKFKLSDYTINIYNDKIIEKGIADFCNEVGADLIAIETHGRTGISHLINGSLAEDVAIHEDRSVLSVKIKEHPEHIAGTRWYLDKIGKTAAESKGSSSGMDIKHFPKFSSI